MHTAIELRDEERTRCEVWTRVMGYHRPVSAFNPGKQSEQSERRCFKESTTRGLLSGGHAD
ncbi:MAG: anaerobic ribonucleoside-triphosphate reductase [Candidatus Thiodiazotropha sp.]